MTGAQLFLMTGGWCGWPLPTVLDHIKHFPIAALVHWVERLIPQHQHPLGLLPRIQGEYTYTPGIMMPMHNSGYCTYLNI